MFDKKVSVQSAHNKSSETPSMKSYPGNRFILLLVPFLLFPFSFGCSQNVQSGLTISPESISFGEIDCSEVVRKSTSITITNNRGQSEVVDLIPNCGCIVSEKTLEIPAQSSKNLNIEINIAPQPGLFCKEMAIAFKNGVAPSVVGFTGRVLPNGRLVCVPETVNYGIIEYGKLRSFKVFRHDGSPVGLKAISCPAGFEAKATTAQKSNDLQIDVRCVDVERDTKADLSIEISTTHAVFPILKIPIKCSSDGHR